MLSNLRQFLGMTVIGLFLVGCQSETELSREAGANDAAGPGEAGGVIGEGAALGLTKDEREFCNEACRSGMAVGIEHCVKTSSQGSEAFILCNNAVAAVHRACNASCKPKHDNKLERNTSKKPARFRGSSYNPGRRNANDGEGGPSDHRDRD